MIRSEMKKIGLTTSLIVCLFVSATSLGQDVPIEQQKFIFFPHPMSQKWTTSVGLTATTFPYDITEEMHYRVPAGDFHVIRKISNSVNLDCRISFQVLQNLVTLGPRWTRKLNNRFSMGAG